MDTNNELRLPHLPPPQLPLEPPPMQQPHQLQEQYLACNIISMLSISFWAVIWIMHLCALTNAKMKFKTKKSPASHLHQHNQHHIQQLQQHHYTNSISNMDNDNDNDNDNNNNNNNYLQHNHEQRLKTRSSSSLIDTTTTTTTTSNSSSNSSINEETFNNNNNNKTTQHNNKLDINHNHHNLLIDNYNHHLQHDKKSDYSYISLPLPGVSIIKPLVGVDKNLFYNLETFFHLDYPTYEILFCVQDSRDAAILVVEELFKKYPNADAKLFIGGARVGVNPKINNMQPAYEHMKYELILISDSGISMRPDTLTDMIGHMTEDVALVHQMPFVNCNGRDNFQSIVERVYFGTAHARAYLFADLLNINCPTGMSALMRKCLLDEVGGIKAFSQYLAEDFFIAKSFTDRGWKLRISSQPALQNSANSSDTLSTFNSRIQRWIKLRFAMVPLITLLEPFSECMLLGLLGALSMSFLWALNPFIVFSLHVLLWFLLDYQLLCIIQNGPVTCSKRDYLAAWLIRECTALVVFMKAVSDPRVNWRSREFKIRWGGYTEEICTSGSKVCEQDLPQPILTQKSTDFVQQQQKQIQCFIVSIYRPEHNDVGNDNTDTNNNNDQ